MKTKLLLLVFALVFTTVNLQAVGFTVDGIDYTITSSSPYTVAVVSGGAYTGAVTIPTSVDNVGTIYSVTSIKYNAFYRCSGLTSVTIPNSVTSIGDSAFKDCTGLTSVTIGNSVTSIGINAFFNCIGLTSVTIPNSVITIGNYAFSYCSGLTSITIGNSVTSIGNYAFSYCSGLTSVTIPNSVTSIGSAFFYCSGLTSVTIPNSVTSIGNYAFLNCSGLTSIYANRPTPVNLSSSLAVFDNDIKTTCTLYVPTGSTGLYDGATQWTDFTNIVEQSTFQTAGNWSLASNWSVGLPGATTDVIIAANCNVDGNFPAKSLTVNPGKVLTINPAGNLTINGTLTNNGTVAIKSDATGTGSLIVASVSGSGTASAERYMTKNAWHLVSPIVEGGSISTFIQAGSNDIPFKNVSGTNNYAMMDYNETTNMWKDYYTASTIENLTAGKGYSVRRATDGVITFTGTLTSGTKQVTLTKQGAEGWNCIGNPYTSAINMNDAANGTSNFLKSNSSYLDGSYACMYVWDDATLSYKILGNVSFDTRDLLQNVLQAGQGFFVKAAYDGVIVQLTKNMQVHQTGTMFKAPALSTNWPGITLTATGATTNSSAIIAFNGNMTNGLDPTYDAGLLRGTNGLSLYTRLVEDNGVDFAIQCLPENYSNLVIPMGVDSKDGGEITFSAETVELPKNCKVMIEDKTTNTFTSLAEGGTYKTTVLAGTTPVGRFYIHTSENTTTGISGLTAETCSLKAYMANEAIIIEGEVGDQAIATLYNLQGVKVRVNLLQKGYLNTIPCSLSKGIYLLTIQQNGKTATKKLIKE